MFDAAQDLWCEGVGRNDAASWAFYSFRLQGTIEIASKAAQRKGCVIARWALAPDLALALTKTPNQSIHICMDWFGVAISAGGLVGAGVAVAHGTIMQQHIIEPVSVGAATLSGTSRRLASPLMHFSTACWLVGGLTLTVAPALFHPHAVLALGCCVAITFLYGAAINCWASRARHPGWLLMGAATLLVCTGLIGLASS